MLLRMCPRETKTYVPPETYVSVRGTGIHHRPGLQTLRSPRDARGGERRHLPPTHHESALQGMSCGRARHRTGSPEAPTLKPDPEDHRGLESLYRGVQERQSVQTESRLVARGAAGRMGSRCTCRAGIRGGGVNVPEPRCGQVHPGVSHTPPDRADETLDFRARSVYLDKPSAHVPSPSSHPPLCKLTHRLKGFPGSVLVSPFGETFSSPEQTLQDPVIVLLRDSVTRGPTSPVAQGPSCFSPTRPPQTNFAGTAHPLPGEPPTARASLCSRASPGNRPFRRKQVPPEPSLIPNSLLCRPAQYLPSSGFWEHLVSLWAVTLVLQGMWTGPRSSLTPGLGRRGHRPHPMPPPARPR